MDDVKQDDEFLEFEIQDWESLPVEQELWIENWDEEELTDDFSLRLRQELLNK